MITSSETIKRIIVVEDDPFFQSVLKKLISQRFPMVEVSFASNLASAEELFAEKSFHLAICDYHLPDAENGEAIEYLTKRNVPTVVLTGTYNPTVRDFCETLGVAEIILKNAPNLTETILSTIQRIFKNFDVQVMVVDDSRAICNFIEKILSKLGFKVIKAYSAKQAEEILFKEKAKVKLILLDYYLETEAIELLYAIRKVFSKHELGIIVLSAYVSNLFVPHLLKAGANDFLRKPFLEEELKVRVNNLLDYLDAIEELTFLANHDPLTGVYNRRAFFEKAEEILHLAKRNNFKLALVVFDLDNFKKINDTYGHTVGDMVLMDFANKLKQHFQRRTDLIARFGGEEFILLCSYDSEEKFLKYLESFRKKISDSQLRLNHISLNYTFSAGVEFLLKDNLDSAISSADSKLYLAKSSGKNRIVYS